ncbi:ATP-binding protein [Myxococcota bacterium]|nr:ATP-binding protein [Myxococcota bacterium]
MRTTSSSSVALRHDDRPSEVDELARKLGILAFTRVVVVTLALVALFFVDGLASASHDPDGGISWQYVLVAVVYGLSLVYALLLSRKLAILALAYVQIVLDTLIATTLVLMTGGIESVFAFVYVVTVIGASMTLLRRGAIVAWLSFFLTLGAVLVVQLDGHLEPNVDPGRALFSFLLYSVGVVAVGMLASRLALNLEVTGRRLAEKETDYAQLKTLQDAILSSLPAGLMTLDADGVVHYANDSARAILTMPDLEIIGAHLGKVVPAMAAQWDRFQHHGGREGERERFEVGFEQRDGKTIRLGYSFAPLSESAGLPMGTIVVFQDVTDFVRLKESFERAERLASVGKVAAGLAHEVRNPLASMCASIDVLKRAIDPPDPMKRLMTNVVREADRLNALITDFLAFARPREPQRRKTDLSGTVTSVVDLLKNDQLFAGVKLELELEPGVSAWIDGDQMRQVLWNLARNAAEAMAGQADARLKIATQRRGEVVEIDIVDSGPGIPPDELKRIFDPFFTTKEAGTGLGLSIVHAIVEAHGGRIQVENGAVVGTRMTIVLPLAETPTIVAPVEAPEPSVARAPSDLELLSSSGPHPRTSMRGGA